MKLSLTASNLCSLACALLVPMVHAQIVPTELVAPKLEISDGNLNFTIQPSVSGRNYQLQGSDSMAFGTWTDVGVLRSGDGGNIVISTPYVAGVSRRFYRFAIVEATPAPAGFSLISAGTFQMGDPSINERPVHTVFVSAFYMGTYEVTKEEWDAVRAWGSTNGYTDLPVGGGKGANHPVHSITWYDMVKWCNARSEKENLTPCYTVSGATYKTGQNSAVVCDWRANGNRLPTEAEWEKAARGGVSGKLFPWGTDTISQSQANYMVYSSNGTTNHYSYDVTPRPPATGTLFYHPSYTAGGSPYSSPVGSFAPNGYGLYDMAGNMREWCWDWYGFHAAGSQTDPRGSDTGSSRVIRGGGWSNFASFARCADFSDSNPTGDFLNGGFRVARGQP